MKARSNLAIAIALGLGISLLTLAAAAGAQTGGAPPEPGLDRAAQDNPDPAPGMRGPRGMDGHRGGWRARRADVLRELDLSKEQRAKIDDLRDKQQRQAIRMRADLATARLDLRRLTRAENPDRAAINRQLDRTTQLRGEMAKARMGTMLDIRAVLTPEQQARVREHLGR